jgi:hypothetical protein
MKTAIIIISVILAVSYIIRKSIVNLSKSNPLEFVSNYSIYMNTASVCGITFFFSLFVDIILVLIVIL